MTDGVAFIAPIRQAIHAIHSLAATRWIAAACRDARRMSRCLIARLSRAQSDTVFEQLVELSFGVMRHAVLTVCSASSNNVFVASSLAPSSASTPCCFGDGCASSRR